MKRINKILFLILSVNAMLLSCKSKVVEDASAPSENGLNAQSKTIENMQAAYKNEVNATAKYKAFSAKAEEEGFHTISLLYLAVSASENIHATNHKAVIELAGAEVPIIKIEYSVKSTKENLHDNIATEEEEAKIIYPNYISNARLANNELAIMSLNYAKLSEKKHRYLFELVLGDISSNTLSSIPSTYFVCTVCGNTFTTAPKHCEISLTDNNKFIKFE